VKGREKKKDGKKTHAKRNHTTSGKKKGWGGSRRTKKVGGRGRPLFQKAEMILRVGLK